MTIRYVNQGCVKRLSLILLVFLASCTATPSEFIPAEDAELTARIAAVSVAESGDELLQLSDEIRQSLIERVDPDWGDIRKFRQLSAFLFGADEMNIRYDVWLTHDAKDTFDKKRGNCLSLSSLFVAAARHLDIDSYFETVEVAPKWAHEGNTMIRYEHIVAAGRLGQTEYVVDFLPEFTGEKKGRLRISDEQALALYYSNRAVEAMINEDFPGGIHTLLQALRLWPENSSIWSNLGAGFRRTGDSALAEASYRRALKHDRHNYSALANLTRLYLMEGRDEEADQYLRAVSRYYRRNPYYHFQLARMQITRGDLERARKNLERATALEKDDPRLYDALADTYNRLNNPELSMKSAKRAESIRQKEQLRRLKEQSIVNPGRLVL